VSTGSCIQDRVRENKLMKKEDSWNLKTSRQLP
jgi:hypothetical protein